MLCMEVSMVYIVVVDGKGYGLFGSEEVAWEWARTDWPVLSAQGYVKVVPFEFVSVNPTDDSELPDAARKMWS
jgi:hypothetical protein